MEPDKQHKCDLEVRPQGGLIPRRNPMIRLKKSYHSLWPLVAALSIGVALLASGCMWGVAIDSSTGVPVSGATVSYTDSGGRTASTTTDANGLYSFAFPAAPLTGPITIEASAPGYPQQTMSRTVSYTSNPNASLDNILSFWDIQHLSLSTSGTQGGCTPPPAPPAGAATLCQDPGYCGLCETFTSPPAGGPDPDLSNNGIGDNQASSIMVAPGTTVTLCDLPSFAGTCEQFTGDDPDLSDNLIGNDRTSSIGFPLPPVDLAITELFPSNPGAQSTLMVRIQNYTTNQFGFQIPVGVDFILECEAIWCPVGNWPPCGPPPYPVVSSQVESIMIGAGASIDIQTPWGWNDATLWAGAVCRIQGLNDTNPLDNERHENPVQLP